MAFVYSDPMDDKSEGLTACPGTRIYLTLPPPRNLHSGYVVAVDQPLQIAYWKHQAAAQDNYEGRGMTRSPRQDAPSVGG
jgi:hypothetical protein